MYVTDSVGSDCHAILAFRTGAAVRAYPPLRPTVSFWDRLCGTYTPRVNFGELRYGLDGFDDAQRQSLAGLLTMPFVKF